MKENDSRELALKLLNANTASQVQQIVDGDKDYLANSGYWKPYGGREKNWDTVGNQQSNPVGAFVELLVNGIDAILLRKAAEAGITDFKGSSAPQSMTDAVKRFFPFVNEGKIQKLSPRERTKLAEDCIRVGIKRERKNSKYPTYVIIDNGCGQAPRNFPKTFLSLGEKNKEGIPFVQGKFNMGSTGSLRFCTRSDIMAGHYKLIVSRAPDSDVWGWTLIRVRDAKQGENLPVTEYFAMGDSVPSFSADQLNAFFENSEYGIAKGGTIVKLYEYAIGGDKAHNVDIGLYDALSVNLIDCALPILLHDFDSQPLEGKGSARAQGVATRTFAGLHAVLGSEATEELDDAIQVNERTSKRKSWNRLVAEFSDEDLGSVRILATGVQPELKDSLKDQTARTFYTLNGQAQAFERASFFDSSCKLGELRNNLIVDVKCDGLTSRARATIFMPDRERKADNELSKKLRAKVVEALSTDEWLKRFQTEIRMSRVSKNTEDETAVRSLLSELIKADPAIKDLFGGGTFLPKGVDGYDSGFGSGFSPGNSEKFDGGKQFPTFLRALDLKEEEEGRFVKDLPENTYRRAKFGTDAANDYLTRNDSQGVVVCIYESGKLGISRTLLDGTLKLKIEPGQSAKLGDEIQVTIGFNDNSRTEPLSVNFFVRIVEAEPTEKSARGENEKNKSSKTGEGTGQPEFVAVSKSEWSSHSFDDDSGAYVSLSDQAPRVYINIDNRYLVDMRLRERDEATRKLNENIFKMGLGILSLALYKKARDTQATGNSADQTDPDAFTRSATESIAPYITTIIMRLGGTQ